MASVTAPPHTAPSALSSASAAIRIEPPRGLLELRLREVWAYRELLYFFVWRDVKIRYKQTAIGILWVILQPVLTMLVFTLFFGRLAKLPSQGLPYPVFYFAALVPWTYFSYALQMTTSVVVDNQRLITKVYFPRLILPISSALSGLVDFAIGFVVLAIFTVAYGIRPTLAALWLPALLALAVFTALGVGLWLSALNALYRDVRYVIRWLPLGHHRPRPSSRSPASRFQRRRCPRRRWRRLLLQSHGDGRCGSSVKRVPNWEFGEGVPLVVMKRVRK